MKDTVFVSSLNIKNSEVQRTECVLFEHGAHMFLLFDCYADKKRVIESVFTNDTEVVYFGGQSELRILNNFGLDINGVNFIDVGASFWNEDTSKTNQTFLDVVEQVKGIDADKKNGLDLIQIQTYRHKQKGFLAIDEKTDQSLYENAKEIFSCMKYIYENSLRKKYADDIDNELSHSLLNIENGKINLDVQYIRHLKNEINEKVESTLNDIFCIAGKKFNINSPKELNYILNELGIKTDSFTRDALEKGYEQTGIVLFRLIDRYRKFVMYNEQYIKPLYESAISNGFGRFRYKTTSVPCLTAGHYCFVKERGIVDVSTVQENEYIWTDFGFKKVLWTNPHKTNDITKVELSNGMTVIGTSHHPILVNVAKNRGTQHHSIVRRWVSLGELFIGENVICNYDYRTLKAECNEQYITAGETICRIINTYATFDGKRYENSYLKLENIQFSHAMPFTTFKSYCEFVGLKFWCFTFGKTHYDIVFYDENSMSEFYDSFKYSLSNRTRNYIECFLNNLDSPAFRYEHENKKSEGYFNLMYEETTVVSISHSDVEMTVYDIEVEDVHEYNANGIRNHNTGRLASSRTNGNSFFTKLNIQSVPKLLLDDINIRKCLIPKKDCMWCCIDFKAQEMRLAAYLYGIKRISEIPLNNDIYTEIGKWINLFNGTTISEKKKRDASKVICLGMIYGLSNYGIARQLKSIGIDVEEGHDFRKSFHDLFPELESGQRKTLNYAHAVNGIYTISGRFRKINFTDYDIKNELTRNNRIALNTVIQGACGDIMRIILNKVENEITPYYKRYGFALLSTIHDEINVSIPRDESLCNEILKKIISIMTKPIGQLQDLQFGCSVSTGSSWGELSALTF